MALPAGDGGLAVTVVGAGLSMAACRSMPSWRGLVDAVAAALGVPAGSRSRNAYVDALEVSRSVSPRPRNANPTRFQLEVRKVIEARFVPENFRETWRELARAFTDFLEATETSVIVDMNYDSCVETLLREAGRDFVRVIGSEVHWLGGRPANVPVVWKIHGSTDAPATIVLSPSEYQRIYETNALGSQLASLGRDAREIWTVGVGLAVDDIWAYLCGPAAAAAKLVAIYLRSAPRRGERWPPDPAISLASWGSLVEPATDPFVLWANDLQRAPLHERLPQVTEVVRRQRSGRPRTAGRRQRILDRAAKFEAAYCGALERGNDSAALEAVDEHRNDFDALREYLLSASRDRIGERWCPEIQPTRIDPSGPQLLDVVERAILEVRELMVDGRPALLPVCAAQAATAYAVELAELLGAEVRTDASWPMSLLLAKNQQFIVGMNPFFVHRDLLRRCNLMRRFETKQRAFALAEPAFAIDDGATDGLLTEDEWEAAMHHFYRQAQPCLRIGDRHVSDGLELLPPLYPWGFRLHDVTEFRRRHLGGVSRIWALVDRVLPGGYQVCKGGSLRDRGRRSFRIGSRGTVRIGEHDVFVQPARFRPA